MISWPPFLCWCSRWFRWWLLDSTSWIESFAFLDLKPAKEPTGWLLILSLDYWLLPVKLFLNKSRTRRNLLAQLWLDLICLSFGTCGEQPIRTSASSVKSPVEEPPDEFNLRVSFSLFLHRRHLIDHRICKVQFICNDEKGDQILDLDPVWVSTWIQPKSGPRPSQESRPRLSQESGPRPRLILDLDPDWFWNWSRSRVWTWTQTGSGPEYDWCVLVLPRLILCSYFLRTLSDGVDDGVLLDGLCLLALNQSDQKTINQTNNNVGSGINNADS